MNLLKCFIFILLCTSFAFGQEVLTLEQAIEAGLVNNNLLQASKKQKEIASVNVTMGNAGFLPTLNLFTSNNISNTQLHQKIFTAALNSTTDTKRDGVIQSNYNGNLALNWVIFNGMRRTNMYQRLKDTYEQASAQTKVDMENTISNVTKAYYEILRQQEISQAYQNNLALYIERLRLAEAKQASGMVSKSDVLMTKVDINTQKAIIIGLQTAFENAKIALNQLLNREASTPFTIAPEKRTPSADTNLAYTGKTTLLITTQKSIDIASRQYSEANSSYFPLLSVGAAYNFAQAQSTAGQTRLNQTVGPNAGFTLSWNLFDGMNKNRIRKTGMLNIDVNRYWHQENIRTQQAAYQRALVQYRNAVKIFDLETESYGLAKESNDLARERYEAGNMTLVTYKDAQLMLENTKLRLANARYDALSMEVELKRLNGELVK